MTVPPIQPLPVVMTTLEVAEVLRCSVKTVQRYVHGHQLAAIRIGRERRFRADDVLDFLASRPVVAKVRDPAKCQSRRPDSVQKRVGAIL